MLILQGNAVGLLAAEFSKAGEKSQRQRPEKLYVSSSVRIDTI